MKKNETKDNHSIARRRMIKALPFLAIGGVITLLSSCSPVHNTARRTGRRTGRRVSRRR